MSCACPYNANLTSGTAARLPTAWLLLFVLLGFAEPLGAQELSYKKYGVKEGLPGLVVYHCLQDKKGFTWFATNRGVSRFDGKVFKNFSKEDGLPDNEIIKLYVDRHNNVWFISFLGKPSVLYKGAIRQLNCEGVFYIVEDIANDSIFLLARQSINGKQFLGYYRSVNKSGNWKLSSHFKQTDGKLNMNQSVLRASTDAGGQFYFTFTEDRNSQLEIKTRQTERKFYYSDSLFNPFWPSAFLDVSSDKKGIVFHTSDTIFYADINGLRPLLALRPLGVNVEKPSDVNFLFCENDSILWLCTKNRGLIRIANFRHEAKQIQYFFPKSYCSSILKDGEGGYWITTLEDGVYYVPSLDFFTLTDNAGSMKGSVKCIRPLNPQQLAAGFSNGTILTIHLKNLKAEPLSEWGPQNKNNRIMDLWPYGKDRLLIGSDRGIYIHDRKRSYSELNDEQGLKGLYVYPDLTVVSGSSNALRLVQPSGTYFSHSIFNDRVTCLAVMGKNYYWGTLKGGFARIDDVQIDLGKKHKILNGIISHIDIAPDSSLWISTPEGVVILKNESIVTINKNHGLLSNRCNHILFDSLTAWVSTDQGISRIDYQWQQDSLSFRISNIMEIDGLLSSDVNQTALGGGYIWAATEDGISFFSKNYTGSPYTLPPISITRVVSGNTELPVSDTIRIGYKKSNLLVELLCPSYRSCGNINYEYRISSLDSQWRTTNNNYIEFSSLPFGEYVLEVSAINKWGHKPAGPKRIFIVNTPPFWKSTWFLVMIYIVTSFLIGMAFYFFNRARHRKKEQSYKISQRMRDLEIMALRAQMNPHFIFNCMSSIQYYILRNDAINANLYLHKFSALIRRILQYTNAPTISLTEEITLLSLYLELEKMRLQERMDFRIVVQDGLDTDAFFIPPMIIQPYIENAVKHGISPLQDKKGIVTVTFERADGYIHCSIDDNGIGINASRQNASHMEDNHMSMGNSITEHRITTINSLQKNKVLLKIFDKQELHAMDTGTVVHLSFPEINE
jgi:ligand-binding sensor domain-containing protein